MERLSPAARVLVFGACAVVVAAGMQAAATLVSAVALSIVLAAVLAPVLRDLRARGVPAGLAVVLVLVPLLIIGAVFSTYLITSLVELLEKLPTYASRLMDLGTAVSLQFLGRPDGFKDLLPSLTPTPAQLVGWATHALQGLALVSNDLLLSLFIVLFAVLETERFPARLQSVLGPDTALQARFSALGRGLRGYVVINGAIGIVVAVLRVGVLWLLGVDFALLWGAWSLVLTYVPTVGYPLAVLPPTLMALIDHGLLEAGIVFVAFGIINVVVYNVLQPKWAGESLDLSPLVVIVSLFFWGIVLGAMGALLAVPLTMMVRMLLDSSEQTRWLAELMGDRPVTAVEPPAPDTRAA